MLSMSVLVYMQYLIEKPQQAILMSLSRAGSVSHEPSQVTETTMKQSSQTFRTRHNKHLGVKKTSIISKFSQVIKTKQNALPLLTSPKPLI